MTTLNLLHSGRLGIESRFPGRRGHRFDLHSERLEFRRLLSTGHAAAVASSAPGQAIATGTSEALAALAARSASVARLSHQPASSPAAVANPSTATITQANPPTDNSSTMNTPVVSPTTPAPLNVATDNSASLATSPTSRITALNLGTILPITAPNGGPVYLVPMPVPPTTIQLSIATPGSQATNSPVTLRAINSPVGFQANNTSVAPQNQPPASIQQFGQSLKTELQKPLEPHLGPQPVGSTWTEVVEPVQPLEPTEPPRTGPAKTAPTNVEPSSDETPPPDQAPPEQGAPPVPAPGPQPADGGGPPAVSSDSSPHTREPSTHAHTGLSTLFGIATVAGGGIHLAMDERARFGMRWLPRRAASARSARPARPAH